jgi:chromosome segregation ATPase
MYTRQDLYNKIHNLNLQVVKEWVKQVYYRKENQLEQSKILSELNSIEGILNEYISLQNNLLDEAVLLTQGTFKRVNKEFPDKSDLKTHKNSLGAIESIKTLLETAMDIENSILLQYKQYLKHPQVNKYSLEHTLKHQANREQEASVKSLQYELENQKKSYAALNAQYIKLLNDSESFRNTSKGFRDSSEPLSRQFNENLSLTTGRYRLDKLNSVVYELKSDNEKLLNDLKQSYKLKTHFETSYNEILKKLEQEQTKSAKIQKKIESLLEDSHLKDSNIEKSQYFIKKLTENCENLTNELKKAEDQIQFLETDLKTTEKTWEDLKKRLQDHENLKKSEETLQSKNEKLKKKLLSLSQEKEHEIGHLSKTIQSLLYEKETLEADMEDLVDKLNEIDVLNKERIDVHNINTQKIKDLHDVIQAKDLEIGKINEQFRLSTQNKDSEAADAKSYAEILIRQFQPGTFNPNQGLKDKEKTGIETFNYKIKAFSLAGLLQEAFNREILMKSQISKIIHAECNNIVQGLYNFNHTKCEIRREIEQLTMRNEELEQRLTEMCEKCENLLKNYLNIKKILEIKDKQIEDQIKLYQNTEKSLENNKNDLKALINTLIVTISKDILPTSQQTLLNSLDRAHKKIQSLQESFNRANLDLKSTQSHLDKSLSKTEAAQNEIINLKNKISQYDQDYKTISAALATNSPGFESSFNFFIPGSKEICKKIKDLQAYNFKLQGINTETAQLLKIDKETLIADIKSSTLESNENFFRDENSRLRHENKYLRDIALNEKDEKVRLKTHLDEETSFFKSQVDHIKTILATTETEKLKIENEYFLLLKRLKE